MDGTGAGECFVLMPTDASERASLSTVDQWLSLFFSPLQHHSHYFIKLNASENNVQATS
jgi:hypothetical protein